MKKLILSSIFLFAIFYCGSAQTTTQGTVTSIGSNQIEIYANPNNAVTNALFGNIYFTISILDQTGSGGNPSFASIAETSLIPSLDLHPADSVSDLPNAPTPYIINGRAYYSYAMFNISTVSTTTSWTAGTSNPVAILSFPTDPSTVAMGLRLEDLSPSGGPNQSMFWYVQVNGIGDITNYTSMFYGTGAVNTAQVSESFVPLQSNPVPVLFTGFSAVKKDDNAVLNWAVVNEDVTTDHYVVERSLDDKTFTDIAIVAVKGNGSADSYAYSDDNISALNASVVYYRVGEVDKNGQTVFTGIKAVSIASDVDIKAYPNPTKGNVTLTITLQTAADLALSLVDASGKTVQQLQVAAAKGTTTEQLDLSGYASGSYLLKVNNGTDITTLPIVKQ
jgi:hypothetical protein